mgnify:CR=1 FL=1
MKVEIMEEITKRQKQIKVMTKNNFQRKKNYN